MPDQNDIEGTIRETAAAYERARRALADELGPVEPQCFDQILSLAEEFGAKHVCTLAQQSPVLLGLRPDAVSSETRLETLKRKLQRFIDSNTALDRVVGQREAERLLPKDEAADLPGLLGFSRKTLDLHTDCSAVSAPPDLIVNYCSQAASTGGETLLVDMKEVYEELLQGWPGVAQDLSSQAA
jgi:hypothetical protein